MFDSILVLMSTYNGEKYINEQIDSILAQENCSVQLVVRDDGSKDRTISILQSYQKQGKLTYYTGPNMGPAKSFMTMIQKAPEYDYYAFADQDDVWLPCKLEKGIEKLKKYKGVPALYSSNMKRADKNMNIIAECALPEQVATDFESVVTVSGRLFGCTMVFNKAMADFIKKRELPDYIVMHDLWLAMIASLHNSLIYDPVPYIKYRTHSSSVTFSKNIPLVKKIRSMFLGSKDNFSRSCETFVDYIGADNIIACGHWRICDLLLNYNTSVIKKMKLQRLMIHKKDMSFKLRVHHVVQILFGKY